MEDSNRNLVNTYKDILVGVPQDLNHHPEGDVFNHVRLVRKAVDKAISTIQFYKNSPSNPLSEILSNIDLSVSKEEKQILFLAAWMHDLGKTTATTVDKIPFRQAVGDGKIQAWGHETPKHYEPQIERLRKTAPDDLVDFYDAHKEIINFLIERHMDFSKGGFNKLFLRDNFQDGKLKNDPKLKLLLMLMWADKMGRGNKVDLSKNQEKLIDDANKSKKREENIANQSKPFDGGIAAFKAMLQSKGIPQSAVDAAIKSKFGS